MEKATSTIVIAFLSGLVIAGGGAYLVSSLHRPAVEQAVVTAPAAPAAIAQPAAPAPQPPAETQSEDAAKPVEAAPAPEPKRHKPRPAVEREAHKAARHAAQQAEIPQPAHTEVAQNNPPAAGSPQTAAPVPAAPAPPPSQAQVMNPPPGTQTAAPPPREPKTITLAAGMPITVRINEKISTNTNYAGDTFTASLEKPIIVDGFVIADRGSRVIGKVLKAEKAGRVKGLADLSLGLTEIHTTDGQTVTIQTAPWDKEGPTSKKRDAAEMAGGAALGAIIGAIAGGGRGAAVGAGAGGAAGTGAVLTTRGKPAEIASETPITFSLNSDVSITERLNQ